MAAHPPQVHVLGLGAFFAAMYFVQGIGDPASGLVAQPVRALLKSWGESPAAIGAFMALLSIPWMLKPAFALLADFVPLAGSHRRNYLLLASVAATSGLIVLYLLPLPPGARALLLACLLLPTLGIAFGDVLVDALMIETGQPRGLTGRLQAIQWASVYCAMLLSGTLGGYLSARGESATAYLVCALLWAASLVLALAFARDTPRNAPESMRTTAVALAAAWRIPGIVTAALFLFVWSFNPSWESVQYLHLTTTLGFSEQAYGNASSAFALGCVTASLGYVFYCRRISMGALLQLAILTGVLGYGVYLHVTSVPMLYFIGFIAGCANMTGNLVQLDLVARLVPLPVAATCFALFMALTNVSAALAEACGSYVYEQLGASIGMVGAYRLVVMASALIAASCWLLLPRLERELTGRWAAAS